MWRQIRRRRQGRPAVRQEVQAIAEECSDITDYTARMNARADAMQQSAQTSAETTGAKTEEILRSLNDAIEKSKSVNQIKNLTGDILAIAQQTRLISLNASVDAAYIRRTMDDFHGQTQRLKESMSGIADSIGTINKAIDESASGIAGMAGNTRSLAADMEDITRRMGVNQDVVAGLEKETAVFDNL